MDNERNDRKRRDEENNSVIIELVLNKYWY